MRVFVVIRLRWDLFATPRRIAPAKERHHNTPSARRFMPDANPDVFDDHGAKPVEDLDAAQVAVNVPVEDMPVGQFLAMAVDALPKEGRRRGRWRWS